MMGMAGFLPPYGLPFVAITVNISGREFQGGFLKADPDHHVITAKLLAMGTRVVICGEGCLAGYPGHGVARIPGSTT